MPGTNNTTSLVGPLYNTLTTVLSSALPGNINNSNIDNNSNNSNIDNNSNNGNTVIRDTTTSLIPVCVGECSGLTYSWWMLLVVVTSAVLLLACVFPRLIYRCLGGGMHEAGADELQWENEEPIFQPNWNTAYAPVTSVLKHNGTKKQILTVESQALNTTSSGREC